MGELYKSNELYHYGVLGMKWGVHRGRQDEAFSKAIDKHNALTSKTWKTLAKAYTARSYGESIKYQREASKYAVQDAQWVKEMQNTFGGMPITMFSPQTLEKGKELAGMLDHNVDGLVKLR